MNRPETIEETAVVEVNDGTDAYNACHYRVSFFYDLCKAAVGCARRPCSTPTA
jgi:hypothetical protein